MGPPIIHVPGDRAYGTGGIQSPPDERDLLLDAAKAQRLASATDTRAATQQAAFRLGNRPPLTDQGDTPQCVSYVSANEQNWQDRVEHGRFFDFDRARFFREIGGTSAGAVMRAALDRLVAVGFPEQDSTPRPDLHQAQSYALVTKSIAAIKAAVVACGGVVVIGPWYPNWTPRSGSLQVLPRPSGGGTGHGWWGIGWDEYGLLGQNSWGSLWGDHGLFRMPWPYVVGYMWEVWTTLDERTVQAVAQARIKSTGVMVRNSKVFGADGALEGSTYAKTTSAGIRRIRDGRIVAEPYNRPLRFGGFVRGARHGLEPFPRGWARVKVGGYWRGVARPLVRLV